MSTFCHASLNYASPEGELVGAEVGVEIRDGRAADLPGWSECGFELVAHASAVSDWTDDEEIAASHYGEVEQVAHRLTGCDVALVSDHVKRSSGDARAERRLGR